MHHRFPSTWTAYIREPKVTGTRDWLLGRREHEIIESPKSPAEIEQVVKRALESSGYRTKLTPSTTTEYELDEAGRKDFSKIITRTTTTVFGQSGAWNRLESITDTVFGKIRIAGALGRP